MNPTRVCALAITGLGWFKEWAPRIAQAVIAPIGMVVYDPRDPFPQWVLGLIKELRPPNMPILFYDEKDYNKRNEKPDFFGKRYVEESYGMIILDTTVSFKLFLKAMDLIAPGGTVIVHQHHKPYMVYQKTLSSA